MSMTRPVFNMNDGDSDHTFPAVGPKSGSAQIQGIWEGNTGAGMRGAVHDPKSSTPYSDGFYQGDDD